MTMLQEEGIETAMVPMSMLEGEVALSPSMLPRALTLAYVDEDVVSLTPDTPDLDAIEANFADEHRHTADEVRFIVDGEGIFDIRSIGDKWIRIEVRRGDYIQIPAGRYHRFFLTKTKTITAKRLFKDHSGWEAVYRDMRDEPE